MSDAHSGNSLIGLSMFLNRRMMSAKEAAVQKYCCLRRSSLPTVRDHIQLSTTPSMSRHDNSQVVWSFGYRTEVIASALFDASTARS